MLRSKYTILAFNKNRDFFNQTLTWVLKWFSQHNWTYVLLMEHHWVYYSVVKNNSFDICFLSTILFHWLRTTMYLYNADYLVSCFVSKNRYWESNMCACNSFKQFNLNIKHIYTKRKVKTIHLSRVQYSKGKG